MKRYTEKEKKPENSNKIRIKNFMLAPRNLFQKAIHLKILNLVCFFSLVFSLFYISTYTYGNLYLDIFTARDIKRALGWLKGDFYWHGPEMYGGSWLPGPFFYFLLFPPLLFGGNIYTKFLIWRIAWLALSYTMAFHFAGKICKHKESLFIFVMFLTACIGPSLFTLILFAANPAFAIMFHILAIMALYTWKETGQNKNLYFLGLIIGFGVQVHALISVYTLTAFILFLMKKKKLWKSFLWFIILIVLPCLPYLGFYNSYMLETLKAVIKNLMTFKPILPLSEFWVASFHVITSFKPYLAGPILLFLLSFLYKTWLKKIYPLSSSSINLFIIIVLSVCIPSLVAGNTWYAYHIPILLMLLFSKLCDDLMPNNPDKKLNGLFLYGVLFILPFTKDIKEMWGWVKFDPEHLIVTGLFLTLIYLTTSIKKIAYRRLGKISILLIISFLHLVSKNYTRNISHYFSSPQIFPSDKFEEDHWIKYYFINGKYIFLRPFLQQIALDTNWPVQTAIKRMYVIGGIDREVSLQALYSLAKEQIKNTRFLNDSKSQIHGYFIVAHLEQFVDYLQKNWKEYLSHSPYVSSFVQEEIKQGKVLLQNPKLYNRYWLIPYKLTRTSVFPENFYNIGQPYYWEEPYWLKTCPSTKNFTRNNYEFYYCMILPGHLQRAGVHITFSKEINKSFIRISFFGPILGIKAEASNIDGHAYWSDIQVSLFCNNNRYTYPMPNIGHDPKLHLDLTALSQSLNSPLKLKIPIICNKEEVSKVNLRFKHWKRIFWNYSDITPEQKDITWDISR